MGGWTFAVAEEYENPIQGVRIITRRKIHTFFPAAEERVSILVRAPLVYIALVFRPSAILTILGRADGRKITTSCAAR